MSRATPEMREFAGRLIAYERRAQKSAPGALPAAFQVCEKLRPHLATLMGGGGVRAVLGRALALTAVERSDMKSVRIEADGSLANGSEADGDALDESGAVLVAELLGLLIAFIGERLILQMLREVWPRLALIELYFRNEDQT